MSDKQYSVVQIDELEPFSIESLPADSHGRNGTWRPVRRRLSVSSFGVNAYTAEEAGQCVVPEHRDDQEELYIVVSGRAGFALEGKEHDAPAGTLVHCPPETLRTAFAAEPGTTVLAVGATPGEAYRPSGWEWAFTGFAKLAEGDGEGARAELEAGIAAYPEAWQGPYNYACLEASLGNDQAALERLENAARLDPENVAKRAPEDTDFAALKDDPRFQAIIEQAQAGGRQM